MKNKIILCLLIAFFAKYSFAQVYVNAAAIGNNDGSSWGNAFANLQDALAVANSGQDIWVAEGTYKTTSGTDRKATFVMKNNIGIYGGFVGTEISLEQRDWKNNTTILSGEIGDPNTIDDNSYNVLANKGNNLDDSAILNGFTITGGNASDPEPHERGGGMFNKGSSPAVINCHFYKNGGQYGAALYNLAGSHTIVTNCLFTENVATGGGGGIYNFLNCEPTITNCQITDNHALSQHGGGLYNFLSKPTLINCNFSGNSSVLGGGVFNTNGAEPIMINCNISGNKSQSGGGFYNTSSTPTLINCNVIGNLAEEECGGIYNFSSSSNISNSIIWGNKDMNGDTDASVNLSNNSSSTVNANHSLIQGQFPDGNGNIDGTSNAADPLFTNAPNPDNAPTAVGNFQLMNGSPAINAGDNALVTSTLDLAENDRIYEGVVDLGPYEFSPSVAINNIIAHPVKISPNPSNGIFTLDYDETVRIIQIEVYHLNGQPISNVKKDLQNDRVQINLYGLNTGIYIIKIQTSEGLQAQKVMLF